MARRRFVDPDFWTDRKVGKLAPAERLLFIGLFSNADDEGRILGDPAYLRSIIFPYDDFTVEEVRGMRDHIVAADPNVIPYENAGEEYIQLARWDRYQKPRYPKQSKLPPPEGWQRPEQPEEEDEDMLPSSNKPSEEKPQGFTQKDEGMTAQVGGGGVGLGQSGSVKSGLGLDRVRSGQYFASLSSDIKTKLKSFIDLTEYDDLIDFEFSEMLAAGPQEFAIDYAMRWWRKHISQEEPPKQKLFEGILGSFRVHLREKVAAAMLKGARYGAGKHPNWKYIEKIIKELEEEDGR